MNIELINEMENAGFTREQTMVLGKVIESDLATRQDIKDIDFKIETVRADLDAKIETVRADLDAKIETVRADLDAKIETVRADLKRDIAELNSTLTFRMVCVVGVAVGFLGTMMTVFKFLV